MVARRTPEPEQGSSTGIATMAIIAEIYRAYDAFAIDLYEGGRARDVPPAAPRFADSAVWFFWLARDLDRDIHTFAGIKTLNLGAVTDADLAMLKGIDLPRVDIPAEGIVNATIADVLRREVAAFRARQGRSAA